MTPRLFDRLAAGASMLILIALGVVSYLLAMQADRSARPTTAPPLRHEPDYYVAHLKVLKVNQTGQPSLRLLAEEMHHYPDDNTLAFVKPHVLTLDENEPAFEVTADNGVGPDDGSRIDLTGHVVMIREETPQSARLEARTTEATVYIDDKVVVTDQAVQIDLGPNHLDGVGMRLDGQTRELQVDSRVRGTLAPDAGRK